MKFCPQCKKETNNKWEKCPLEKEGFTSPVKMKKCCCCDICKSKCSEDV